MVDSRLDHEISKHHALKDIGNSFQQESTPLCSIWILDEKVGVH